MDYQTKVKIAMKNSQAVIMLLDGRFPEDTKIKFIERAGVQFRKPIIYVATKADLISFDKRKLLKDKGYFLISSKTRRGRKELIDELEKIVKTRKGSRAFYFVIVGYPDVGKSSLINYLVGRKRVKVSPIANTTHGQQYIKLNEEIMLVDTPGIFEDNRVTFLGLRGGISPEQVSDAIPVVYKIIKLLISDDELDRLKYYDFKAGPKDVDEIIDPLLLQVAKKRNLKLKGGDYNLQEAAKILMRDFQRGKW